MYNSGNNYYRYIYNRLLPQPVIAMEDREININFFTFERINILIYD
jgi:hypothetical protein